MSYSIWTAPNIYPKKYVGKASKADRKFFARRPERSHRVRLAHRDDIAQIEDFVGEPVVTPPGYRMFLAIRQIAPGYRMKVFGFCPDGADMNLSEEICAALYDGLKFSYNHDTEMMIRSMLEARNASKH